MELNESHPFVVRKEREISRLRRKNLMVVGRLRLEECISREAQELLKSVFIELECGKRSRASEMIRQYFLR